MVNKKRHMKVKLWSVRTLIILFFAISAITLSQGIVYVQDIVKERFFSKTKTISERNYDFTSIGENFDDSKIDEDEYEEVKDTGIRTKTGKNLQPFERESLWSDVLSVLSNVWITIVFYVIIAILIIYAIYKYIRNKLMRTEIVQEKESITKQTAVRSIKNEKVIHQLERPLPTDKIKKNVS